MATAEGVLWAFAYLGHVYPMEVPTVEELTIWQDVLDITTDDQLREAVRQWCKTPAEFPPKPGQLREMARHRDAAHHEFPELTAGELAMVYPDPVEKIREIREAYNERFRPDLRVVGDDS